MRLLADEHVKPAHVSALVASGHDVSRIGDVGEKGVPDSAVREAARETDRIVIAYDRKDFSTGEGRAGVFIATEDMKPTEFEEVSNWSSARIRRSTGPSNSSRTECSGRGNS